MVNSVCSTVDNGRTHLSYNGLSIDSIDSYNNCFTKLFAWVFGWSVSVEIDGKIRSLNKADYANWINSHTDQIGITASATAQFTKLCLLNIRPPQAHALPINQLLSPQRADTLFRKLVRNFHNPLLCTSYVKKGASLNQTFWTRGEYGISFGGKTDGLPDKKIQANICKYTPLLYAADRAAPELCLLMKSLGASPEIHGERYDFSRDLVELKKRDEIKDTQESVPNGPVLQGQPHPGFRLELHQDLHTDIIARFKDTTTKRCDIVYDNASNRAIHRPLDQIVTNEHEFERVMDSHKTRLF